MTVWNVRSAYATWLGEIDDLEGAKKAWQAAKDVFADVNGAQQIVGMAEASLKGIEQIGHDPTEFPDDAKDLDGKLVTLADFKGKVLLIDFWATWCGPCRAEMPNVVRAYERFHDKGFEIVGISHDRPHEADKVREFVTAKKMPWRQVYYPDEHNKVATAYEVNGIPHTVLIGRDGKIIRVGLRGDGLQKALEKLFPTK